MGAVGAVVGASVGREVVGAPVGRGVAGALVGRLVRSPRRVHFAIDIQPDLQIREVHEDDACSAHPPLDVEQSF